MQGMKKNKKFRWILMLDEEKIGEAINKAGVGKLIGCTDAHISLQIKNSDRTQFIYKKKLYTIVDKLDLI